MKTFHYINHLLKFSENDDSIKPSHISMYLAIFQLWGANNYKNPISISRKEIMKMSKINSSATYHKCLKQLNKIGLITYKPCFNPYQSSQISVNKPNS